MLIILSASLGTLLYSCVLLGSLLLAKGISAGLWVDLEAVWAFASGRQPGVTCKRSWDSAGGSRRDFMVGCPRAAAAVARNVVEEDRWILPHLAVRTHFEYSLWVSGVSQPVQRTPLWPASGCLCLIRVVGLSLPKFKGYGESMMIGCNL